MPRDDLPTAEQCEETFHAALRERDIRGVEAALLVLAVQDPHRAQDLFETTKVALELIDAADAGRIGITRADLTQEDSDA